MALDPYEAVAVGGLIWLVFLLVTHHDRAIGTKPRPDLKVARRGWPLIGNLPFMIATRNRVYEQQLLGKRETGTNFTMTLPFLRMISINDIAQIEYVQKTNFQNYEKGPIQRNIFRDILGGGIFASDGAQWVHQRKTTSHLFSGNSFRTVITSAIDEHLDHLVAVLGKAADAGREVALNEVWFRFTLDTFVRMSFGKELGSVAADRPVPFAEAFDYAQTRLDERFMEPGWHVFERFTPTGRRMREALRTIDDFSYDIIDSRDRQAADEKTTKDAPVDLLALYRNIRDEKGQPMSRVELRDAVLNLIIAGRDTTAQALSWAFFYIVSDPALLEPVRQEVREKLGDGGRVTYDNYNSLVRTKALFYEAVRLHPSVPKNGKTALADDQIPNGPRIQAGDIVSWSDWVLARTPEVWGDDAAEFRPARWIADDGSFKHFTQYQFHSFNAGPRLCLGQNLATFEGMAAIVTVARNFDLTFAPDYLQTTPMTTGIVDTGKPCVATLPWS